MRHARTRVPDDAQLDEMAELERLVLLEIDRLPPAGAKARRAAGQTTAQTPATPPATASNAGPPAAEAEGAAPSPSGITLDGIVSWLNAREDRYALLDEIRDRLAPESGLAELARG